MELYVLEDGKSLRCGYTTGTAAAIASHEAARALLFGFFREKASLMTPKGIEVEAEIEAPEFIVEKNERRGAVCAVKKDGGDDKDITNGILIFSRVSFEEISNSESGIDKEEGSFIPVLIEGGEGIGTVKKPGLSVPVGEKAINPVPKRMIREAVRKAIKEYEEAFLKKEIKGGSGSFKAAEDPFGFLKGKSLKVTIYVPGGEKIAESTFNKRLGIEGGISIIGTSGIVEPMSKKAFSDAVCLEIRQIAELYKSGELEGEPALMIAPGNYGMDYIEGISGLNKYPCVMISNFIGEALDEVIQDGFKEVLLVGHAGKLLKVAGGIMNTHSRMADCRMELICAHAAIKGAGPEICQRIMEQVTTDACLDMLKKEDEKLFGDTARSLLSSVEYHLRERIRKHEKQSDIKIGALIFYTPSGLSSQTGAGMGDKTGSSRSSSSSSSNTGLENKKYRLLGATENCFEMELFGELKEQLRILKG